jgi:predicted TIM-barrel fold metal-dependent hydrolase
MDIAGVWSGYATSRDGAEPEDYPFPRTHEFVTWAVREVGADKLLWGTDYPSTLKLCTYGQYVNYVRTKLPGLSADERALILGGTAEKLLARVGAS